MSRRETKLAKIAYITLGLDERFHRQSGFGRLGRPTVGAATVGELNFCFLASVSLLLLCYGHFVTEQ